MIVRVIGIACAIGIGIGIVAADNFEVYSGRKGCESIVKDRERGECDAIQRKKNEACNINASATSINTSARSTSSRSCRRS